MADESAVPEDKVGYGNPPKDTQFQPGQSGNPGGRPKRHKGLSEALLDILEGDLTTEDDKPVQGYEVVALTLVQRMLAGDRHATQLLFRQVK
jgi:hypothetical protein